MKYSSKTASLRQARKLVFMYQDLDGDVEAWRVPFYSDIYTYELEGFETYAEARKAKGIEVRRIATLLQMGDW